MCHLTATKQTSFKSADATGYYYQADEVFEHYKQQPKAEYTQFAFMARGEPLANAAMLSSAPSVLAGLGNLALSYELPAKFCISTIFPRTLPDDFSLARTFGYVQPTMYYSIYSVSDAFRSKWLPHALPVADALRLLVDYQQHSKKFVKLHFALIAGENDSERDIAALCTAVEKADLLCEVNLVRYNPATSDRGRESDEATIGYCATQLRNCSHIRRVDVIQRVSFDVKASCGMFVGDEDFV